MISEAKKRIKALESSVRVFEKKKAAGVQWPGIGLEGGFCADDKLYVQQGVCVQSRSSGHPKTIRFSRYSLGAVDNCQRTLRKPPELTGSPLRNRMSRNQARPAPQSTQSGENV